MCGRHSWKCWATCAARAPGSWPPRGRARSASAVRRRCSAIGLKTLGHPAVISAIYHEFRSNDWNLPSRTSTFPSSAAEQCAAPREKERKRTPMTKILCVLYPDPEAGYPSNYIVMTGRGDVQTAMRAMKAGTHDFIEKPFDDEWLLSAIDQALALPGQVSRARVRRTSPSGSVPDRRRVCRPTRRAD